MTRLTKAQQKKLKSESKVRSLNLSRDKGVFDNSIKGEIFGEHPNYCDLRIDFSIYSPSIERYSTLPSLRLELLCGSYEEAKEMKDIIETSISNWISGWEHRNLE